MYKEGIKYPNRLFFICDDIKSSSISDIQKNITTLFEDTSGFKNYLLQEINSLKGYELFSLLLNYFPDLLFYNKIKFTPNEIKSKFIDDKFKFVNFILNNHIDLEELSSYISEIEKVSKFNNQLFFSSIYNLLFKNYFIKIAKYISFSETPKVSNFINYEKEISEFLILLFELREKKPYDINNYNKKKIFFDNFKSSFIFENEQQLLSQIEQILCHTDKEIEKTLSKILQESIIFEMDVTPTMKNKHIRNIYKILICAIMNISFSDSPKEKNQLAKKTKNFLKLID